jgi:hypothetical protein
MGLRTITSISQTDLTAESSHIDEPQALVRMNSECLLPESRNDVCACALVVD